MRIQEFEGYLLVTTQVRFCKENYDYAKRVIDNMFDYSKMFFKEDAGMFRFRLIHGRVK